MFRATVRLDERAKVAGEVATLKANATRSGLKAASAQELADRFSEALEPLIESGRNLKAMGSQMDVTRTISGSGYRVHLRFAVGRRPGFFERLRLLLSER